jgi:hypothetical protein
MKALGMIVLLAGTAMFVVAGTPSVPEIDGNSAVAALVLASGSLLVMRARRKK